jgi:hypothetical protein
MEKEEDYEIVRELIYGNLSPQRLERKKKEGWELYVPSLKWLEAQENLLLAVPRPGVTSIHYFRRKRI